MECKLDVKEKSNQNGMGEPEESREDHGQVGRKEELGEMLLLEWLSHVRLLLTHSLKRTELGWKAEDEEQVGGGISETVFLKARAVTNDKV